jgi:hypothetical protein
MKDLLDILLENKKKESFKELWDKFFPERKEKIIKEYNNSIRPRENDQEVLKRYERIKKYAMLSDSRHEVAASFYFAFAEKTSGGYFFKNYGNNTEDYKIPSITHYVAFEIACDILVHFIYKYEEDDSFKEYVKKNIKPDDSECQKYLSWFIEKQEKNELLINILVNYFTKLEDDVRQSYNSSLQKQIKSP